MTEISLRENLYDWIQGVLNSFLPANAATFIWHMQDISRPSTPILEGRLSNDIRIGRDTVNAPDNDGVQIVDGDREFVLYLTYFGTGAWNALQVIRNATHDPYQVGLLQSNGIAIIECHPILDAHVYLDTMPEDRATMDIRMRLVDSWTTQSAGLIEHANASGKINGVAALPNIAV